MKRSWLTRAQYEKVARFVGPQVARLLLLGTLVGFGLFIAEVAFAYGLQLFLVAIGALDPATARLPTWLPSSGLKPALAYILVLGLIRGLLQWAQQYMLGASEHQLATIQRSRLLTWAFRSESASSAEITVLFGETTNRACAAITCLQGMTVQTTSVFFLGIALFVMLPTVTMVVGALLVVLMLLIRRTDLRIKSAGQGMALEWDKTNTRLMLGIRNLLLMQIYGTQKDEDEKAQSNLRKHLAHVLSYFRLSAFKFAIVQIIGVLLICAITLSARKLSTIPAGVLIAYFYLFMRFLQTFSGFMLSFAGFSANWPHLNRLARWWADKSFDGLRAKRLSDLDGSATHAYPHPIGWRLSNVSFTYPGASASTIQGLDLDLPPGKTLVITGPSGVGKSTLLNLLIGGIHPSTGSIQAELEGGKTRDLATFRPELLASIGYVGAESFLIEGTIQQNLTYGLRRTPTDAEVREALNRAECQFVFALPNGLQHRITDQGTGLSAGQKQRLALARALLRSPKALILDEATANLDAEIESKLLDTLLALKGQMTIVAVTHRTSVLRIADQHLSLKDLRDQ